MSESENVRPSLSDLREETDDSSGLECPKCGCHNFKVSYTRPKQGAIVRRRICRHCGGTLITWERPALH